MPVAQLDPRWLGGGLLLAQALRCSSLCRITRSLALFSIFWRQFGSAGAGPVGSTVAVPREFIPVFHQTHFIPREPMLWRWSKLLLETSVLTGLSHEESDRLGDSVGANWRGGFSDDSGRRSAVSGNSGTGTYGEISENDVDGVTLAFFGDSYTANQRMPVSYSFTEAQDYWLREDDSDARVWNLGVDSFGTDQVYLSYHESSHRDRFEYIFSQNDLRNIRGNRVVQIDPSSGDLLFSSFAGSSLVTRIISCTYLPYWVLDIRRSVLGVQNLGVLQARTSVGPIYEKVCRVR